MDLNVPTQTKVTPEQVIDFVITAVEHMGHGCLSYILTDEQRSTHPGPAYSEKVGQALLAGEEVRVTDRWDYDEEGTLTLDALLKGIGQRADQRGLSPKRLMEFIESDVFDADAAVQYALWDRIVLG